MLLVTKPQLNAEALQIIVEKLTSWKLSAQMIPYGERHFFLVEDLRPGDEEKPFLTIENIASVIPLSKPYPLASFDAKNSPSRVCVGKSEVGGEEVVVVAGPCAVESREQVLEIAHAVKNAGCHLYRGGVHKPRSSPYYFQGIGDEGLEFLVQLREETGLPVVTEVVDTRAVEKMVEHVDCLQIGSRNMQNFALLKEVGKTNVPILLKRGMGSTIKELLLAAEYILKEGNEEVMLCERGIRTFENAGRYTLDLNAIPILKKETHLPVLVDPSHGIGIREHIPNMALAAVAAGADGIMLETHFSPQEAKSDGNQAIQTDTLIELVLKIKEIAAVVRPLRKIEEPVSL